MQPFINSMPTTPFELSLVATQYRSDALYASFAELNSYVSMLHADVLALLYHYGNYAPGPILEIGPYIGGSTISLARGILEGRRSARVTSVELGGEYRHPTYLTTDIVESLRANLQKYAVDAQVNLIVGHSRDPSVIRMVEAVFEREGSFSCFVIDADGQVQEDIALYRRFLAPRCYLVVDDYYAPGAPGKEATTRSQLAILEQQRIVESFGVHGWGTWFGRFL